MKSGLYFIHDDDYLNHIDDKVEIYDLLLTMAQEVRGLLASGNAAAALRAVSKYEQEAHEVFETWNIPDSYIESGDEDELHELMENELFPAYDERGEAMEHFDMDDWEDYDYPDDDGEDMDSPAAELLDVASELTGSASRVLRLCAQLMEDEFED